MKGKVCQTVKSKCILFLIGILGVFLPLCVEAVASEGASPSLTLHYEAGKSECSLYQGA